MRRWAIVPAVLAALLVAAFVLWPEPDETNEPADTVTTTTESAPSATRRLTLEAGSLRAGEEATFVVTYVNDGEPLTVTFATSQDAEVVLNRDGTEVWRWSAGLAFTQAVREVRFERGPHRFTLQGDLTGVDPGSYVATATLTGSPAPLPVSLSVTVE